MKRFAVAIGMVLTFLALSVLPASAATTSPITSVSLNPTSVIGGASVKGTVVLSAKAPAGGRIVTLSSSNTDAATVPTSVTIAAGATSASFAMTTRDVHTSKTVTVSASYSTTTKTAKLTVLPAQVKSIVLS